MSDINSIEKHEPAIAGRVGELVEMAGRCEIKDDLDQEKASDLLKFIKTAFKKAEDERKALVKPINDAVKNVNAKFKTVTEPLKCAETNVKAKILDYDREKRRIAEEEALKAAQEAEESGSDADLVDAILETDNAPAPIRGDHGSTTSIRKAWKHEITDASKVPAEFLMVDDAKVKAAIKGGIRDIPGLRIYEDETVVSR